MAQGLELEVHHIGDVHAEVGLVGGPHVDLLDPMGLQSFVDELGEAGAVAGQGVDGVQGHGADGAVVGVVEVHVAHDVHRLVGEYGEGTKKADVSYRTISLSSSRS